MGACGASGPRKNCFRFGVAALPPHQTENNRTSAGRSPAIVCPYTMLLLRQNVFQALSVDINNACINRRELVGSLADLSINAGIITNAT